MTLIVPNRKKTLHGNLKICNKQKKKFTQKKTTFNVHVTIRHA